MTRQSLRLQWLLCAMMGHFGASSGAVSASEAKAIASESAPWSMIGGATLGHRTALRSQVSAGLPSLFFASGLVEVDQLWLIALHSRVDVGVHVSGGALPWVAGGGLHLRVQLYRGRHFGWVGEIQGLFNASFMGNSDVPYRYLQIIPGITGSYFYGGDVELYLGLNIPIIPFFALPYRPIGGYGVNISGRLGMGYYFHHNKLSVYGQLEASPGLNTLTGWSLGARVTTGFQAKF